METERVFSISIILSLIGSCLLAAVLIFFSRPVSILLGASNEEIASYTADYLQMIAFSFPIIVLVLVISVFFQFYGLKKEIAISAVLLIFFDVTLNFLNVKVLKGGMRGMAGASVLSYCLSFGYMVFCMGQKTDLRLCMKELSFCMVRHIFRYGMVYLVYKLCTVFLSLSINQILSHRGNVTYLAANSILSSVSLVTGAFASGIGSTATMLFSYHYGRKDQAAIKETFQRLQRVSFLVNLTLMMGCILGAGAIVSLFQVKTAALYTCAVGVVKMYALCLIFNSINYIYKNYDMCMEQTKMSYLICILNNFLLPFAAALGVCFLVNLKFLWICYAIGQGMTTLFAVMIHQDGTKKGILRHSLRPL